jgi:two-component system, OmpR family, sensor histidine kinase CreC
VSFRLRLILVILVVYSLGGWLITRWAIGQVRPRYFEAMEDTMVETALLLAGVMEAEPALGEGAVDRLRTILENTLREPYAVKIFSLEREDFSLRVMLADAEGRILYDSRGEETGAPRREWSEIGRTLRGLYGARAVNRPAARWSSRDVLVEESHDRLHEIYVGAPIHRGGEIVGVVSVGKPTSGLDQLARAAQRKIFLGMAVGGVALLGVLLLMATWVAGPLERLAAWARAARDGRKVESPRVPGGSLRALRDALVEMRDALDGRDAIERYTRTLAHEIKAPLTAIRGSAELLGEDLPVEDRRRFEEAIRDGAERIRRLVDELLALARLERREAQPRFEAVDLGELVRDSLEAMGAAFAAHGVNLRQVGDVAEVIVEGDRSLLGRALGNLLQNALEFAPAGGTTEVRLSRGRGHARIEVLDDGPGIPEYARERIFERFYSLPRPLSGKKSTGLGLSLAREIMELHGGTLMVLNRPEGGVRAELRWP